MVLLPFLLLGTAAGLAALMREAPFDSASMSFADFVSQYAKAYGEDEYDMRRGLFEKRVADFATHNDKNGLWEAGVNHLTDWTDEELFVLRGYKPVNRKDGTPANMGFSRTKSEGIDRGITLNDLPATFSWGLHLESLKQIQDQGRCGSCWAVASTTVLRSYTELYSTSQPLSAQQIVSCTPNPEECGGQGGCHGATAELAMEFFLNTSYLTDEDFPYTATDAECIAGDGKGRGLPGDALGMVGFRKLPENDLPALLLAVYLDGPVAVSIAADSSWSWYWRGIMDSCREGAVVNHLVTLTGWGEKSDGTTKYWLLQNSWGEHWGEGGYLRLLRREHDEESKFCGWDTKPEDGTGCKGGPEKVWTCGSCGILYDSVVPHFLVRPNSWWANHGVPVETA